MYTIKIPFPDISFYEKTRFEAPPNSDVLSIDSGTSSIYLRSVRGFSANDYIIIEAFESEDAEIVKIQAVDTYTRAIDLTSETTSPHSVGVVVIKTPYDQVKIYKGTSTDTSIHTILATVDLRPDNAYTVYIDPIGTSSNYYSYSYYNSSSLTETTKTLFTGNDYDSVLTVEHLRDWFMFGLDLTDDSGYPFPNSMFEFAIRAAVDSLEKTLQIKIKSTIIPLEYQDYFRNDYMDFAFIQLNQWPIQSVQSVKIKYPTSDAEITFPAEWQQIRTERGQINLIPTSGSLSQILIGQGGDYLTFIWRGWDWMPNFWRIAYTAGFASGTVPSDIIGVLGKMAAFYPLNIAGDLVGGIAVASKSIGIDGLSQSLNTTSSAENAGYCVVGETEIETINGLEPIKNLVGKQPFIYSVDNGRIVITKANCVWKTKANAEICKVVFDDCTEINATPNHPIKLLDGAYVPLEKLNCGDIVLDSSLRGKVVKSLLYNYSKADVYDMEVNTIHNFIANSTVVHNSARLRQYERELKVEIPRLQAYYKAMRMAVL